jgi:hypothetical protein
MKEFNEPNTLLCHFEHYKIAHAGLDLSIPFDTDTADVVEFMAWLQSNGWILVATKEIVLHYQDDEDVADSKSLH